MKLIIVRHGQTPENLVDITQGQLDTHLSQVGIIQAQKLAKRLKNEQLDFIYCSDLARTKETLLEIIKFHPDTPVIYDERLREWSKGEAYQGKPRSLYFEAQRSSGLNEYDFKPVGAESRNEQLARAQEFLSYIQSHHEQNETILAVTHAGWKQVFFHAFFDLPLAPETMDKLAFDNTAVSVFEFNENGRWIRLLNCSRHLG